MKLATLPNVGVRFIDTVLFVVDFGIGLDDQVEGPVGPFDVFGRVGGRGNDDDNDGDGDRGMGGIGIDDVSSLDSVDAEVVVVAAAAAAATAAVAFFAALLLPILMSEILARILLLDFGVVLLALVVVEGG